MTTTQETSMDTCQLKQAANKNKINIQKYHYKQTKLDINKTCRVWSETASDTDGINIKTHHHKKVILKETATPSVIYT